MNERFFNPRVIVEDREKRPLELLNIATWLCSNCHALEINFGDVTVGYIHADEEGATDE